MSTPCTTVKRPPEKRPSLGDPNLHSPEILALHDAGPVESSIVSWVRLTGRAQINAAFLQSGFHHGTDQPEELVSKLQKSQEFLNSEGERLHLKIDSAVARIKAVETRSGARGGR
jgi:hypothetical protein